MTRRTYLIVLEAAALDIVKQAVALGYEVCCERVEGGWLITVVR